MTVHHKEPDRVPFDLGSMAVMGIHIKAYSRLRRYIGLTEVKPRIFNMLEQVAVVDDYVLDRVGVDVRNASSSSDSEIAVEDMGEYTFYYDEFHIGWRMHKDGGLYLRDIAGAEPGV